MLKRLFASGRRYTRRLLKRASLMGPRLSSDAAPLPGETVDLERRVRELEAERDALAAALKASRDPMRLLAAQPSGLEPNAILEAARDNNELAKKNLALAQSLTAPPRDDRATANFGVHLKAYVMSAELARVQQLNAELQNELRTRTLFPPPLARQSVLHSEFRDACPKARAATTGHEPQTPPSHAQFQSVAEHLSKVLRQ